MKRLGEQLPMTRIQKTLRLKSARCLAALPVMAVLLAGITLADDMKTEGGTRAPFAVVELFTSEGCSSCPPADKLLAEMVADSRAKGDRVYPLAFHVDYWNTPAWRDRFSDSAYSHRQSEYAKGLGSDAYTPQMIVNGKREFVGSDRVRSRESLAEALSRPASVSIRLQPGAPHEAVLPVDFSIEGSTGAVLQLAVVERGLVTQVKGGENSGRELRHENVVRVFRSVTPPPAGKGHADLALPKDLKLESASLIGYVQDPKSLAILGAASIDLR